jgi:hypothetical protein
LPYKVIYHSKIKKSTVEFSAFLKEYIRPTLIYALASYGNTAINRCLARDYGVYRMRNRRRSPKNNSRRYVGAMDEYDSAILHAASDPDGIRTRVPGVKGLCPNL